MRIHIAVAIALALAYSAFAADEQGAKAIFVDSTSSAVVHTSNTVAAQTAKSSKTPARKRAEQPTSTPVPEVSGLMYYVELVSPNGETSRVTSDRVFSSGERILLHVVSSIDGDITIFQRATDGRRVKLFPDERIRNGSAHIAKGVDTILPSPTSWFRFDNNPETEELTLVLTPRTSPDAPRDAQAPIAIAVLQYDELVSAAGSKGLLVETDRVGSEQGTYVVRRTESGRPPEPIVVAVQLKHR